MFGPDDYVPYPQVSYGFRVLFSFCPCAYDNVLLAQLWGVVPRACTFIFDKINASTDDSVE